jgi:hypothetical protein
MDFIHRLNSKILKVLKIKIITFRKQSQLPKRCDFNIFNILLFGQWIKSINPSPHNIIHNRQNLLEFTVYYDRNFYRRCQTARLAAPEHSRSSTALL